MPLALLILTITGVAGVFVDFILGKKGDKDLKERLEAFFASSLFGVGNGGSDTGSVSSLRPQSEQGTS